MILPPHILHYWKLYSNNLSFEECLLVMEKSGIFSLQGQGKVMEFCKMVREIRKSSKVRVKSENFKIIFVQALKN